MVNVTVKAIEAITAIGKARAPREACGLLLGQPLPAYEPLVLEVPNTSQNPEGSYEFTSTAAQTAIEAALVGVELDDVVVWHTHPSNRAGPSSRDMETRLPGIKYLVVTLTGDAIRY